MTSRHGQNPRATSPSPSALKANRGQLTHEVDRLKARTPLPHPKGDGPARPSKDSITRLSGNSSNNNNNNSSGRASSSGKARRQCRAKRDGGYRAAVGGLALGQTPTRSGEVRTGTDLLTTKVGSGRAAPGPKQRDPSRSLQRLGRRGGGSSTSSRTSSSRMNSSKKSSSKTSSRSITSTTTPGIGESTVGTPPPPLQRRLPPSAYRPLPGSQQVPEAFSILQAPQAMEAVPLAR